MSPSAAGSLGSVAFIIITESPCTLYGMSDMLPSSNLQCLIKYVKHLYCVTPSLSDYCEALSAPQSTSLPAATQP